VVAAEPVIGTGGTARLRQSSRSAGHSREVRLGRLVTNPSCSRASIMAMTPVPLGCPTVRKFWSSLPSVTGFCVKKVRFEPNLPQLTPISFNLLPAPRRFAPAG